MARGPSRATRRGFLGALVGGGTAAASLSPAADILERIAPLSGSAWHANREVPETVSSPYGTASVTYDEYHVPHIEADSEEAAYYAMGYVQAADRLFEMDLYRRIPSGSLAAVVGESVVEQDELYTKLDFEGGAEASARAIEGTDTGAINEAFAEGISAFVEASDPGVPFGMLGYEPDPWRPKDSLLIGLYFYWLVSGGFGPLRESVKRDVFGAETYADLYPARAAHDVPIVRENVHETDQRVDARSGDAAASRVGPALADWLDTVESERSPGSNAWTVSGEYTESGRPVVASDPHLMMQAPPIWYEQRVTVGDNSVRGTVLPGTPLFVVGENDHGCWGMTATQTRQTDLYTYETDGDEYRYRGEWREFETETKTIEVADGEDREVTVEKTVHGPYLEQSEGGERQHVAVGWVGHAGTREAQAFYRMANSTGLAEFQDALRLFDAPTLSIHYADTDGRTLYRAVGKTPVRRVDGDPVEPDRVFDGSAGEAEWAGFEPFETIPSESDGFVSFEEMPSVVDADYVASANQRVLDDPPVPMGGNFANGFRAERIYERLDETVGAGETVDLAFQESLQLDTLDGRAPEIVPALLDVRDRVPDAVAAWLDELEGWDYHMDRDSAAALVFHQCYVEFKEATWEPIFDEHDLGRSYWPDERVLVNLPPDSPYFDGDRGAVLAQAAEAAVETIEDEGWEIYGDYNTTAVDHTFGDLVSGMNYPRYPTDGSWLSVRVYTRGGNWGAGMRTVMEPGGESRVVLAGGNDGAPTSEHYDDQLRMWADGEYRTVGDPPDGDPDVAFEEGEP